MDAILRSAWVYPALETVHLVGIGLLLGSLVVFELRLWGLGVAIDARALQRLALGVTLTGFALAAASGLAMFAAQASELLANTAFRAKLVLLAIVGTNAAWFHARGGSTRHDALGRVQTALSLGLWLAVITCGRLIAYK